jgi:hypothetical protein
VGYRDESDAWLARRVVLEHEAAVQRDLDGREHALAIVRAADAARRDEVRRRLPVLAAAKSASPCDEPFEAMDGADGVRTCVRCDASVLDVARTTLAAAETFCARGRVRRRHDGTFVRGDCAAGARARRTRLFAGALAALVVTGAVVALRLVAVPERPHHPPLRSLLAPPRSPVVVHASGHDRWEPPARVAPFTYFEPPSPPRPRRPI